MSMVFDRRYKWNNSPYEGVASVCRVRAYTTESMGPVIIVMNAPENQGPPVERVLECMICALEGMDDVQSVLNSQDFDSAMWYLASHTDTGIWFYRIRQIQGEGDQVGYSMDPRDSLPGELMDHLLSEEVSADLFRTHR